MVDLCFNSERSQSFEMFFAMVVILNAVVAGFRAETWHGVLFPAGFHLGKSYRLVGQFLRVGWGRMKPQRVNRAVHPEPLGPQHMWCNSK